MVDITNFTELSGERSLPRGIAGAGRLLPHAAFALCFAFTMAIVLGAF